MPIAMLDEKVINRDASHRTIPTTPTVLASDNCFPNPDCHENADLFVPSTSLDAYKTADYWSLFYHSYGNTVGDVKGNGEIDIDDVIALIDYLLAVQQHAIPANCDMDGDGELSICDVTALIDQLLS